MAERFRAAGLRIAWQAFRVPGHRESRNLIGVRRGPERGGKLVTAHYDSMTAAAGGTAPAAYHADTDADAGRASPGPRTSVTAPR